MGERIKPAAIEFVHYQFKKMTIDSTWTDSEKNLWR